MASLLCLLLCSPAWATDALDISVGLKILPLVNGRSLDSLSIAIVFDPASSESKADGEFIKNGIANAAEILNEPRLAIHLVNINTLDQLSGSKMVFIARSVSSAHFDAISHAAALNGALTLSTDLECVKSHKCVVGIVSQPHVEIYYSPAAAANSHISFSSTFTMLVRQI